MNLSDLDLFRKIPRDFTKGTKPGGFLSIAAIVLMVVLFVMELVAYLRGDVKFNVTMDGNRDPDIKVTLRVQMFELPCEFTALDVYDYLGTTRLDVQQNVFKNRIAAGDSRHGMGRPLGFFDDHMPPIQHEEGHDPNKQVSLDLSKVDFMSHLEQRGDKFSFVNFYAGWCSHCQRLKPTWEAFAEQVQLRRMDIAIYKVDCVHQASVCNDQRVMAYPTLRLFKGTKVYQEDYNGDRTVDAFIRFLESKTGVHPEVAKTLADERQHKVEGCIVSASLSLKRVPGNIRIHAKSGSHDIEPMTTNVSHKILNFGFGPTDNRGHLLSHIPKWLAPYTDPLDNLDFVTTKGFMSHDHYLKVVTTRWTQTFPFKQNHGYQFTSASHTYENAPNVPEVKFSFDLSPIMIDMSDSGGKRWYDFLTSVCALVGGIYTVIGLMDTALYATVKRMNKNNQGKLN
mmetsp:Transcript_12797/g.25958  ORF Transcript_12797/g.25958 Transcript_12797/m.25958 type:complete len:453 (-) Transcript_12797:143-1501(-)